MSFESDIIDKYKAIFGGRLYFDASPEGWTAADMAAPFCIINQAVPGEEKRYVDNSMRDMLNAQLQFFVWGSRRDQVANAARALSAAVSASSTADFITLSIAGAVSDYNEVLKLRGSRQDFGFWYKNQ